MKNLLIISTGDYYKNYAMGGRGRYMIKYCSNKYHLTLLYYRTRGHEKKESIIRKLTNPVLETNEKIRALGVKMLFEKPKSQSFNRFLYPVFFTFLQPFYVVLMAYKYIDRCDICIADGLWGGMIGSILRKIRKTNFFVYEDLDIFPYFFGNSFFRMILYSIEKYVVKRADLVVSVSNSLAELRRRHGARNVIIVPNGVSYELFEKGQAKKEHVPTLVYVGGLEQYQGIDLPIKCLPKIKEIMPHIRFLIVGEGPFKNEIKKLIKRLKLEQTVLLLGRQEHEKLPDFFSESDIGVATCKPSILTKYSAPYKIPEYMAAGLPVIITSIGETEKIINESKAGVLINPSEEEFTKATIELLSNTKRYKELSENAVKIAKSYDWNKLFEIEFKEIEKAIVLQREERTQALFNNEINKPNSIIESGLR